MSDEKMIAYSKAKRTVLICVMMLLTAVWITVIFGFSSTRGDKSSTQSRSITEKVVRIVNPQYEMPEKVEPKSKDHIYDGITRKCAHVCVYSVLGILMYLSVRLLACHKKDLYRAFLSVPLSILVAVIDEYNQTLIEGRSGRLYDVAIDTAGILLGTVLCVLALRRFAIKKDKKELY